METKNIIGFNYENLLSYDDLSTIITSYFPNEQANLIASKLKPYIFINDGNLHYVNNKSIIKQNINGFILTCTSILLEHSIRSLNADQSKLFYFGFKNEIKNMCSKIEIDKYIDILIVHLTNNNISHKKIDTNDKNKKDFEHLLKIDSLYKNVKKIKDSMSLEFLLLTSEDYDIDKNAIIDMDDEDFEPANFDELRDIFNA